MRSEGEDTVAEGYQAEKEGSVYLFVIFIKILRIVLACQIPLFLVGIKRLFNSLAITLSDSPFDLSCFIILIISCSFSFLISFPSMKLKP